jgi:putative membrane protein
MKKYIPYTLLLLYILVFIWSGIKPYDIAVWKVEAFTSFVPVLILIILYIKKVRLSPLAYIMMALFPIMHIIGAHYTFSNVPFDWFNELFGFERNMYDRIAHATVGFYAIGIIEMIIICKAMKSRALVFSYALFAIISLAGVYELFEWWYAMISDPTAGIAVLGAQGDIWDAQKDILMDTLGAVFAIVMHMLFGKKE